MGGGGPKNNTRAATTTNIATSNNKALTKANQLYDAGIGGQAYTQSLVPNRAKATTDAYGQIERNARANMGGHGVSGQYQSVINNGGFFGGQKADYDQMRAFSNGNYRTDTSRQSGVHDAANGSYSERHLGNIAAGQYLDRTDPHFERLLAHSLQNASHEVNLGASAAGRYGSAVHQGSVAREVGNVSSQARLAQYHQERAAQVEANAMLDAQRNANLQTRLEAANAISGVQGSDYDRQLSAANHSFGAGQQAYGNLDSAYHGVNMGAKDLISVGQAEEAHAAQVAADRYRIFQEQQNNPWRLVENMNRATAASNNVQGSSGDGRG